jgi:hypothetical protein
MSVNPLHTKDLQTIIAFPMLITYEVFSFILTPPF